MLTLESVQRLLEESGSETQVIYQGVCNDCGTEITVRASSASTGVHITGGAVYEPGNGHQYGKCDACYDKNPTLTNYRKCEVYSRVVGYLRPVAQWNDGKSAEFSDRKTFQIRT